MTREEKIWIAWLLTTSGSFAMLETHALRTGKEKGTLSYTLRKVTGVSSKRPWGTLGSAAICIASGWFAVHIAFGDANSSGR